jgi:gamma-glutamyltranspeptidase/glutathione hydrolase
MPGGLSPVSMRMPFAWGRVLLLVLLVCSGPAQASGEAAIASAHPLATAAGKEILDHGGNAFDAAVAVAAVLGVVEPYSSGLGGGGFFLLHRARDGFEAMIDARETAPAAATPARYLDRRGNPLPRATLDGPTAAAIPGVPAGLAHLAREYGRLPLSRSLAPAIRVARDGFPVDERYRRMAQVRFLGLHGQEQAARQFLVDGAAPEVGHLLKQPRLAATLEMLARAGSAGFYRGPVARRMVAAVRQAGGYWRESDLARYRVKERKPLAFDYKGMRIVSAPPPSAGGLALAESLNILARYDLDHAGQARRMHWVAEALRRAYHDRARYLGDPDYVAIPAARLMSHAYADRRAASIEAQTATPSDQFGPLTDVRQGDNTTHFSIVDGEGNRVAATLSINTLFGSCFVAGDTGVLLNNEMDDFAVSTHAANTYGLVGSRANLVAPGKRPLSSMSPTFVEDKRGVLVLGTPGGSRIISMVLLAILGYAAQPTVDPNALVAAPRYHHQYLPDQIEVEPDAFAQDVLDDLQLRGHVVQVGERQWGDMQAVWVDKATGKAVAASDPRGQGSGMAWY